MCVFVYIYIYIYSIGVTQLLKLGYMLQLVCIAHPRSSAALPEAMIMIIITILLIIILYKMSWG